MVTTAETIGTQITPGEQGASPQYTHAQLIGFVAEFSYYQPPDDAAALARAQQTLFSVDSRPDGLFDRDGHQLDSELVSKAVEAVDPRRWIMDSETREAAITASGAKTAAELQADPIIGEQYRAYKKTLDLRERPSAFGWFKGLLAQRVALSDELAVIRAGQSTQEQAGAAGGKTPATKQKLTPATLPKPKTKVAEQPKPAEPAGAAAPKITEPKAKAGKKEKSQTTAGQAEPKAPKSKDTSAEVKGSESSSTTGQSQATGQEAKKPAKGTRKASKPARVSHRRDGIADILQDGKKAGGAYLDTTGRVRYGGNAIDVIRDDAGNALFDDNGNVRTRRLGRRFMSAAELALVEEHADMIRAGLADRDIPGSEPASGNETAGTVTQASPDLAAVSATALREAMEVLGLSAPSSSPDVSAAPVEPAQQQAGQGTPNTPGGQGTPAPTPSPAPVPPVSPDRAPMAPTQSDESFRRRTKRRLAALGLAAMMLLGVGVAAHETFEGPANAGPGVTDTSGSKGASTEQSLYEKPDSGNEQSTEHSVRLDQGENPWTVSRDYLKSIGVKHPSNAQVWEVDQQVLRLNGISLEQARHLPTGSKLITPSADWTKNALGL